MNIRNSEKPGKTVAIFNIFGEIKYRVVYLFLVIASLAVCVYLNFGYTLEFQSFTLLTALQFIEFNWCEGVKELNENCFSKLKFAVPSQLGLNESNYTYTSLKEQGRQHFENYSLQTFFIEESQGNFSCKSCNVKKNDLFALIEIDEYKPFFISTLCFFSEQVSFFYNFAGNLEKPFFETSASLEIGPQKISFFEVYLVLLFYQLAGIVAYHNFCLVVPGFSQRSRPCFNQGFLVFIYILGLHFLLNPFVIAVYFELQIESLDSELFYGSHFDFLKLWVKCFYLLFFFQVIVMLIIYAFCKQPFFKSLKLYNTERL